MIIMRVILIIEIENLRILYFVNVKSSQITNSRKSKHAKITRSTIYMVNLPSAEYTRVSSAVCVCVCRIHKATCKSHDLILFSDWINSDSSIASYDMPHRNDGIRRLKRAMTKTEHVQS